jgi:hypothetical protein
MEEVKKIEVVDVGKNDIVIITADTGKLRPTRAAEYCEKIAENMKEKFPDNEVWVVPQTIDISVLHMVEYPVV